MLQKLKENLMLTLNVFFLSDDRVCFAFTKIWKFLSRRQFRNVSRHGGWWRWWWQNFFTTFLYLFLLKTQSATEIKRTHTHAHTHFLDVFNVKSWYKKRHKTNDLKPVLTGCPCEFLNSVNIVKKYHWFNIKIFLYAFLKTSFNFWEMFQFHVPVLTCLMTLSLQALAYNSTGAKLVLYSATKSELVIEDRVQIEVKLRWNKFTQKNVKI